MQVVTGGFSQGKLEYVNSILTGKGLKNILIINEENFMEFLPDIRKESLEGKDAVVINHLNLIIKEVKNRSLVLDWTEQLLFLCQEKELIFISDELGCGIIPMEKADREYREDNGRVMCELAAKADYVTRIVLGIPQVLKQPE